MSFKRLVANRFDPFTEDLVPVPINSEYHAVPPTSPYWVRLHEVPIEEIPSAVNITGYQEVYTDPTTNQFRVDYAYGTGYIEFHSSAANQGVNVTYRGLGSAITAGAFNKLVGEFPGDAFIVGHAISDWRGTHCTYDTSLLPTSSWTPSGTAYTHQNGLNIRPIGFVSGQSYVEKPAGGEDNHVWNMSTNGAASGAATAKIDLQHFQYSPRWGGTAVMQFRYHITDVSSECSLFAFFCPDICGRDSGLQTFSPSPFTWTATSDASSKVYNVLTHFSRYGTLPVGFGHLNTGLKYFCTFTRSLYIPSSTSDFPWFPWDASTLAAPIMSNGTWSYVVGFDPDVPDGQSLVTTPTNTLGGYVTDVSTYFTATGTGYDIRVELNRTSARLYVNDELAAIHNTHVPGSIYGWNDVVLFPRIQTYIPQSVSAHEARLDYFYAGYTDPVDLQTGPNTFWLVGSPVPT
jgi:hypothetical protein